MLASFPSPAAGDLEDRVDPLKWVIRHERGTFWCRVSAHSLEAESILDGGLIAVDRAGRRRSGRIVLDRDRWADHREKARRAGRPMVS